MSLITNNTDLASFCQEISNAPFVTLDTEFLRERTYYPKLCLIQLSAPGHEAIAIDPVANPDIDLSPLENLLRDTNILKVMHSGRQDMEIFLNLFGFLPEPYYDTQIAAMVCGYGEQVGYEALIRSVLNQEVDKSKQYTDWSLRPLSDAQLKYALNDVIYLKDAYLHLNKQLKDTNRDHWVKEEMEAMLDEKLYNPPPENLWKRIRIRTTKPQKLAILQDLAIWRENRAKKKDIPRNHILKDDVLAEIALQSPKNPKNLSKIRGISEKLANGDTGYKILETVKKASERDKSNHPQKEDRTIVPNELQPTLEMLKMLLKIQAAQHNVAGKLIAKTDDLEALALSENDSPVLKGWRFDVYGEKALELKRGKIGLTLQEGQIKIIEL